MPATTLRLALKGALAAAFVAALLGTGCTSEPCVGPNCDVACAGDLCAAAGADSAASGGASGGRGGAAGTGGRAGSEGTAGPCQTSANCDMEHGFECVQGECRHACRSHYDCAGEGECRALSGELEHYCDLGTSPQEGDFLYCPNNDECPTDYLCLGAGPGDARAYCSKPCNGGDADCPSGFYCETITNAEGTTVPYCVHRAFCASCESDADCLGIPGQICARDQSGAKICTQRCDPGVDACPWGNASQCGVWDPALGAPTCAHRFGSCRGTGKSCEPCARDVDCPRGFCHSSAYTGEHWCVDQSVTCDCDGLPATQNICENGNGCPESPGGAEMMCFDDERFAGDPFGHHCFGASTTAGSSLASPQSGCWEPL